MNFRAHAGTVWVASWLLGVALLIGIVKHAGAGTLLTQVRQVGWIFGVLLLISGARQALRTSAWSACITAQQPKPRFLRLFGMRLVADAATDLTLAGPLLGESLKVWLTSGDLAASYSLASVVLEDLIYGLAVGCFLLGAFGLALMKGLGALCATVFVVAGLALLLLLIILVFGVLLSSQKPLTRAVEWSKRRFPRWRLREQHEETLTRFEGIVLGYYRLHRKLFYGVLLAEVAATFTGVAEAYLILRATVGSASFVAAYLVEALNRMVTVVFAFIPLRLGVDEGSTALMMKTLGFPGTNGVSLAVIRKLRTLVWVCVGICLMPQYAVARWSGVKRVHADLPPAPNEQA